MKRIISGLMLLFGILVFAGCEDETANLSKITYFPDFEMSGSEVVFLQLGQTYTDAGVVATEKGESIPVTVSVTGKYSGYKGSSIPANVADEFTITYSATNQDGFSGSVSRTVFIYNTGDLVNSIEGLYTSTVVRNGASGAQYTNMKYIMIWKKSDNTYGISDAIGGYYAIGRAYGSNYLASGMTITVVNMATNTFTFGSPIGVGAFGGVLTMSEMSVNPTAKTISFTSVWDQGFTFVVTLKPVVL